ncbi:MAG: hypothetical protein VW646_03120, partial [Hydrogenophilales bacterium]
MIFFSYIPKLIVVLFSINVAANDNSVVKAIDPSDMKSRIDLRNEYRENQGGGYTNYLVPRFEYAISKSFSLRLETPLITSAASSPTIRDTDAGYGDTRLEGRYRLYRSDNWRAILGVGGIFKTADEETLGTGKDRMVVSLLGFGRIGGFLGFPYIEHVSDVTGYSDRDPISYSLIKPMFMKVLRDKKYVFIDPAFIVDHENSDRLGLNLEIEFGKL